MKRWNGWGNKATSYLLPGSAARYLANWWEQGCICRMLQWNKLSRPFHLLRLPPICSSPPIRKNACGMPVDSRCQIGSHSASGRYGSFWMAWLTQIQTSKYAACLNIPEGPGVKLIPYGGGRVWLATSIQCPVRPLS